MNTTFVCPPSFTNSSVIVPESVGDAFARSDIKAKPQTTSEIFTNLSIVLFFISYSKQPATNSTFFRMLTVRTGTEGSSRNNSHNSSQAPISPNHKVTPQSADSVR